MEHYISSYPKVYAIGHRAVKDIFDGYVDVEEKVDGSQFSFGLINGVLQCRSRNVTLDLDNPGMFDKAVEAVRDVQNRLHPEWVYRGEYLRTPKHNTLAYGRTPKNHIILFDVMTGIEEYLQSSYVAEQAEWLGFEYVPHLFSGTVSSIEQLRSFLKLTSILGYQKVEGVVVKARDKFTVDGKMMVAKLVSEEFKEVHQGEWKGTHPNRADIVDRIVDRYRTPARWQKARQHLFEDGLLEGAPSDIPALMKEVSRDIIEEEGDEIKKILFDHFWKTISKDILRGLPEWYKQSLAEDAFDDTDIS